MEWQFVVCILWLMLVLELSSIYSPYPINYLSMNSNESLFICDVYIWVLLHGFCLAPKILQFLKALHFSSNYYNDVIMSLRASQITSLTSLYSTVYSGADQRKHQSSTSLGFVRGINRWPVNSPHKRPLTRKMFPFDDVFLFVGHTISTVQVEQYLVVLLRLPKKITEQSCLLTNGCYLGSLSGEVSNAQGWF